MYTLAGAVHFSRSETSLRKELPKKTKESSSIEKKDTSKILLEMFDDLR